MDLHETNLLVSHLPSPQLGGGEVNEYFLVKPNILRKLGYLRIRMFTIYLPMVIYQPITYIYSTRGFPSLSA